MMLWKWVFSVTTSALQNTISSMIRLAPALLAAFKALKTWMCFKSCRSDGLLRGFCLLSYWVHP